MVSGRDFILVSSIEWDFLWQGHQEIASRLARAGNRVLFVENTGLRWPGLRDARRVAARLANWLRAARSHGTREVVPNVFVCSPVVLPPFGPRWQRTLNRRVFLPAVARAARALRFRDVTFWTYLPTDTVVDLIDLLRTPRSLVVYHCIADFARLTPTADRLARSERDLLRSSDLVLAQCAALAAHCAPWAGNIHLSPFGVNLDAFPAPGDPADVEAAGAGAPFAAELAGLQALPRPVVGYVGGLHQHVDQALLAAAARARPAWSWVCVGPRQTSAEALAPLPNVHLLGARPHRDLARYIERFDVCVVPYVKSAYTDTVVPTKINEYLAMGKAVVSTALPAVQQLYGGHDVVLFAPAGRDGFVDTLERALALGADETARRRRRAVAALSDWQGRLDDACDQIERLARTRPRAEPTPPPRLR